MKSKNLFLLPALIAGLGLMLAGRVTTQTFTTVHGGQFAVTVPRTLFPGQNSSSFRLKQ